MIRRRKTLALASVSNLGYSLAFAIALPHFMGAGGNTIAPAHSNGGIYRFMHYAILLATYCALSAQTTTQPASGKSSHGTDQSFLAEAVQGNLAEIQLGQLAQQNASSQTVKQFGHRMVADHTSLLEQAKSLASAKGIGLPTSPSAKDETTYQSLKAKTGAAFDKAYISDMLSDHRQDIAKFQTEAKSGADADIRALASKALPTLQEHLRLAEHAARQLGIPVGTGGE
jgi:predicted outer membrane protein